MFTKEEMYFTVKEMIGRAIAAVDDCGEYDDAVSVLEQLKFVVDHDQEKAKEYWYDLLCVVAHDFGSFLSFFRDEKELALMESIIGKLYPSE